MISGGRTRSQMLQQKILQVIAKIKDPHVLQPRPGTAKYFKIITINLKKKKKEQVQTERGMDHTLSGKEGSPVLETPTLTKNSGAHSANTNTEHSSSGPHKAEAGRATDTCGRP